jgi:hypothetical protein
MTRAKPAPYKLAIRAPANGRVRQADIELLDDAGRVVLTDRADLSSQVELGKAADRLAGRLGAKPEKVRRQLERGWVDALNRDRERQQQEAAAAAEAGGREEDVDQQAERLLAEMPADVRAEAEAYLRDPDLIERVADDIAALGVAGEWKLTETLYLIGVSRLLKRPAAGRVKGPTSSGKSYVIDQVARLFPAETVIHATQMTPQALFHMRPGSLRHRWIVAGERSRKEDDDTAEATRALREMLASGRLSKLMPVKVGNDLETVPIYQEGPIAYVESTTLSTVFDEDENRCLSLFTDEREEQTQRILERLGEDHAGGAQPDASDRLVSVHHAMQRMLRRREVVIPYAPRLAELIPARRVEARRAFPHLLSMIQAGALLHQHQRGQDGEGRLIATPADYRLARRLLLSPMRRLMGGGISEPARRFHDRLRGWAKVPFTSTQARRKEEHSRAAVYGWLTELHEAGLVRVVSEGRGSSPTTWELVPNDPEECGAVLPPVKEVCGEAGQTRERKD